MRQFLIRVAKSNDAESLVEFNQLMAEETENKQLDSDILASGVKRLIGNPSKGFYLVAEDGQGVVGSLMITTEWSDWRNGTFWWIQSVYVKPEFRRKGIYAALYAKVKTLADSQKDICGYRLYVEKDNVIAQKTYESLGMHRSHYLMYEEI